VALEILSYSIFKQRDTFPLVSHRYFLSFMQNEFLMLREEDDFVVLPSIKE
jgi:hypothetical protein